MPPLDADEARRRLREARVARMATVDAGGLPHVVPVVFAADGDTLYWAVDRKPKRSTRLRRLANLAANPNVEVVVDRYEDDWSRLWWVRARGAGRIVGPGRERDRALALLAAKYPQYRQGPQGGPVVAIDVAAVTGWAAR